jgi:uncharacterized protein (TIGR02001 family)
MKKTLIAAAVAAALVAPGVVLAQAAAEPASPHTLTANVGVVSDYLFRGITQSHSEPAIQGGVDYSHSSGVYVGTWLSSIAWVTDGGYGTSPTEVDVYGGYKGSFAEDFGYDLGLITYNYPGSKKGSETGLTDPFTAEAYGALSWKWFTVKYSHVVSKNFVGFGTVGGPDSKGSNYIELNGAYDLGDGWGISAHVGHQKIKNNGVANGDGADYTDWNVGVTKDVGFGVVGLKYSDTNAAGCGSANNVWCWGPAGDKVSAGHSKVVASFTKSF